MFVSITAGVDLARDIESGFFNRLALTPLRGEALLVGQLGGAFVLGCIQAVVYLLVGLATGSRSSAASAARSCCSLLSILIAFAFASLGGLLALRFGTGEAVQGIFPLLFVTLFLSSSSLPRNLIKATWFRDDRHVQPRLVSGRGPAQPRHHRLGRAGARRSAFGFALAITVISPDAVSRGDADEAGARMRRFLDVTRAVAWRSIHNTFVSPAILLPSIIFPLFFLIAFAGGLSRISHVPNFNYGPGYTSFQFVFVFLQSAAFGGVFTGFAVARDFDSGFARRLLLSAPRRSGIIAGYVLGALARWTITAVVVTAAGLIAGMNVAGNAGQLVGLVLLGIGMNFVVGAVGLRLGDVPAHRAGRSADPDAGVRALVPRPGVRAAEPARRLDPHGREAQPGDVCDRGGPGSVRGIAGRDRRVDHLPGSGRGGAGGVRATRPRLSRTRRLRLDPAADRACPRCGSCRLRARHEPGR